MQKDLSGRPSSFARESVKPEAGIAQPTRELFDSIELETDNGSVVLEGLDQAYPASLNFFWWERRCPATPPR